MKSVKAPSNNGVAFRTLGKNTGVETPVNVNDGVVCKQNGKAVECFVCGGNHYADKCPTTNKDQT